MRHATIPLVALSFCVGLLTHCDVGVPARAGDQDAAPYRSGSRLQAITLLSADGASIPTGEWWDSKLETRCQPAIAADGKLRCLPVGDTQPTGSRPVFSSPACDGERNVGLVGRCEDSGGPFWAYRDAAEFGCTQVVWRIHRRGRADVDAYRLSGSDCQQVSSSINRYELGEEVDPEEFVLLAESH